MVLRDGQAENGRDCFKHDGLTGDTNDLSDVAEMFDF
jgi:hypothetical protein